MLSIIHPQEEIEIGCDSLEALRKVKPTYKLRATTPNYDIAHSIHKIINLTKWKWKFKHVKGHQDKTKPYHTLDIWAKLNIQCDKAAKHFRIKADLNNFDTRPIPLYDSPWKIIIEGYNATDDLEDKLYNHAHQDGMYYYWENHKTNPGKVLDEVNWEAIGIALKTISHERLLWQVKQATNWLPNSYNKYKWNMSKHELCPACKSKETILHMQECKETTTVEKRTTTLNSLQKK